MAWIPSPAEMLQRIYQNEIMKKAGFSDRLIHSIMINERPHYDVVRKMIDEYGIDKARKKLENQWLK